MVVTKNDTTLLLISGTGQLAFRTASHLPFERLKVGKRPEAICVNDDQTLAFVANRFDDSVSVVSLTGEAPTMQQTCSLGAQRELTLAEQGEQTFYDATVSLDGWFSCHSCHTDGHTNGLSADTFGDEDRGAPKRVISLLGTSDTGPWAWVGNKAELEEQIKTSLIISMQTQRQSEELPIASLAAYLRTLKAAPGTLQHPEKNEPAELVKARQTFETVGCATCHAGPALTSDQSYDVGMTDEMGESRFNPPSLRGVSQRAPYFHDGHAATLQDVLKSGHHGQDQALTDEQIRQLELLLRSL
jgi:cytochrome c peroxidase